MDIDMTMNAEADWKMLADDLLTLVPREAVCILSTDLRIVHVNTAWSHIFGHAPEEAIGFATQSRFPHPTLYTLLIPQNRSPWTSRCCGQASG
jgi:PAS domain-containing protein